MFDILSLEVCSAIDRFEGEENAKARHPLDHNHVKHPIIDEGIGSNPHPAAEILPVGYSHEIATSNIKFLIIAEDADPLWLILHECGNRGPEKSERRTAAGPVPPGVHPPPDTGAGGIGED